MMFLWFYLGSTCHSFTLCANHTINALPIYLYGLIKNASVYFSHSTKCLRDFTSIQDDFKMKHLKMPKLSKTRWFLQENFITTLLIQYGALVPYFKVK